MVKARPQLQDCMFCKNKHLTIKQKKACRYKNTVGLKTRREGDNESTKQNSKNRDNTSIAQESIQQSLVTQSNTMLSQKDTYKRQTNIKLVNWAKQIIPKDANLLMSQQQSSELICGLQERQKKTQKFNQAKKIRLSTQQPPLPEDTNLLIEHEVQMDDWIIGSKQVPIPTLKKKKTIKQRNAQLRSYGFDQNIVSDVLIREFARKALITQDDPWSKPKPCFHNLDLINQFLDQLQPCHLKLYDCDHITNLVQLQMHLNERLQETNALQTRGGSYKNLTLKQLAALRKLQTGKGEVFSESDFYEPELDQKKPMQQEKQKRVYTFSGAFTHYSLWYAKGFHAVNKGFGSAARRGDFYGQYRFPMSSQTWGMFSHTSDPHIRRIRFLMMYRPYANLLMTQQAWQKIKHPLQKTKSIFKTSKILKNLRDDEKLEQCEQYKQMIALQMQTSERRAQYRRVELQQEEERRVNIFIEALQMMMSSIKQDSRATKLPQDEKRYDLPREAFQIKPQSPAKLLIRHLKYLNDDQKKKLLMLYDKYPRQTIERLRRTNQSQNYWKQIEKKWSQSHAKKDINIFQKFMTNYNVANPHKQREVKQKIIQQGSLEEMLAGEQQTQQEIEQKIRWLIEEVRPPAPPLHIQQKCDKKEQNDVIIELTDLDWQQGEKCEASWRRVKMRKLIGDNIECKSIQTAETKETDQKIFNKWRKRAVDERIKQMELSVLIKESNSRRAALIKRVQQRPRFRTR